MTYMYYRSQRSHHTDSLSPPRLFNNSNRCKQFVDFINSTIKERLQNGSIECIGRVHEVQPTHTVAPLTVEPTKPRLCVNLMYLNNWVKDVHFNLDTLKDVPRVMQKGAFFMSIDDKSGFDNVRLSKHNLIGFQWEGCYFRCLTLVFGFKLSSYVYHRLNLQPTSYIRKRFGIPIFLYIDDRLIEEARMLRGAVRARVAYYIVCQVLCAWVIA